MDLVRMDERRAVRRSVEFECRVARADCGEVMAQKGMDLSEAGMLISCFERPSVGERVELQFRVPGTERVLELGGRVAHVSAPNSEGLFTAGIDFDSLDGETRQFLRFTLSDFPECVSSHPPRIDYAATAGLIAFEDFGF